MEQTENETIQASPESERATATRKEIEALRRDIESLRADLKSVYQSAKGAGKVTLDDAKSRVQETARSLESWATALYGNAQDRTQKVIALSRDQIRKRPFVTVTGAALAGMLIGRMRAKK